MIKVFLTLFFVVFASNVLVNPIHGQSKPKSVPKRVRCPDEVPTTGWYRNYSYGFSITIPPSLKGYWNSARCVKDKNDCVCMGDHGRHIPIRNAAYLEVFAGPRNYETRKETIDEERASSLKAHTSEAEHPEILNRAVVRLGRFPATRIKLRYNDRKTETKMIEEIIICAPMDEEHGGFVYKIYLVTAESSYNNDKLLLGRIQQTWQFRKIP